MVLGWTPSLVQVRVCIVDGDKGENNSLVYAVHACIHALTFFFPL